MPVDEHHLIFICSPKMKNLTEMKENRLFLNDVPIYDSTRQFLMVNELRRSELGVR